MKRKAIIDFEIFKQLNKDILIMHVYLDPPEVNKHFINVKRKDVLDLSNNYSLVANDRAVFKLLTEDFNIKCDLRLS